MKVLLIGSGGREHALACAIARSTHEPALYAVMARKNPGIAGLASEFLICGETDTAAIAAYAAKKHIDIAVIGPETPLASGAVDALSEAGIPSVGPAKSAARIEFDKAWARRFMQKNRIPGCPMFGVFETGDGKAAHDFIGELGEVAVKPAGLTGGKGVRVTGDHFRTPADAKAYADDVLEKGSVVIEEKLVGEEFTVQAFADGKMLAFSPSVQDHKRAYEGDLGPNTGGMGSYTDAGDLLPFMKSQDYEDAKKIMKLTVSALAYDGAPYKGTLYGQFMLTSRGVKVIEFNARFGDPEAMNVLPILSTDFMDIAAGIVDGTLSKLAVEFEKKATVCKYAVPAGYPDKPEKDTLVEVGDVGDAQVFYSSVYEKDGRIYTTGSRAIAVLGMADTIYAAERKAEAGLRNIKGNLNSRHDIGTPALIRKRIDHMQRIRGQN